MKNRFALVIEIIWVVVGMFSLYSAARSLKIPGDRHYIVFLLMAMVSFAFALVRHKQRKKS
ncbi:MAG: hypothetical protein U0X39_00600 [Bacteroidales bacterium]